jgi:hypothetical protein
MYPQVLQAIIKRVPVNKRAVVHGFQRYAIEGQVFPAVIPSNPDSQVRCVVCIACKNDFIIVLMGYLGAGARPRADGAFSAGTGSFGRIRRRRIL